jgi:hypothetical protein
MAELEDGARDTEQLLLSSQSDVASLKLQLQVKRLPASASVGKSCRVTALQALAAGRQDLQERMAGSDAQLKRAAEDLKLEQERRRVSDEGKAAQRQPPSRHCHASRTQAWLRRLLRHTQ